LHGVLSTLLYPGGQFELICSSKTVYMVAELTHGPDGDRKTVNIGLNASITVNNKNYVVLWIEGCHKDDSSVPDNAAFNK
jgi:hypothetical protein